MKTETPWASRWPPPVRAVTIRWVRVGRADHHGLVAVDDIARAVLLGRGLQVAPGVAALGLGIGEGEDGVARDDLADQLVGAGRLAVLEEAAADHHGGQVGLHHQGLTQLLHDDHVVGGPAAQAALVLGERGAQDAEFVGEGLPDLRPPAGLGLQRRAALVEAVVVGQVAGDGVAQHRLFFGEAEVHRSSPRIGGRRCPPWRPVSVLTSVVRGPAPSWR